MGTVPFDGIACVAVEAREQGMELAEQRTGSRVALQQVTDLGLESGATEVLVLCDPVVVTTEQKVQAVLVAESELELLAELALAVAGCGSAECGRTVVGENKALGLRIGRRRVTGAPVSQQVLRTGHITGPRVARHGLMPTGWIGVSVEFGQATGRRMSRHSH